MGWNKTKFRSRVSSILRENEGTSIVLVTIIAVLIIVGVVILRVSTSSLWASADKQYNQDQAFLMATTMGDSIDALVQDGSVNFNNYTNKVSWDIDSCMVSIEPYGEGYLLTVTAESGTASYVYSAYYIKTGRAGTYSRNIL